MIQFSDFVENFVKTPICCELKRCLDKLYELYTKNPEKYTSFFLEQPRGSSKTLFLSLLPSLLKIYENLTQIVETDKEEVPENLWPVVEEYCKNDVLATEAVLDRIRRRKNDI